MEIVTWIVQGLLAVAFLMAGLMKATQPAAKIREKMPWATDVSDGKLRFIGVSEILGGMGLFLPQLTGIMPQFTWLAATAMAVVMVLAMRVHAKRNETKEIVMNIVLFFMLVFVAYSRFYCVLF